MRKPPFDNFKLEDMMDLNGNIPKVGDIIKLTLVDGVPDVIKEITIDKFGYYTPYTLPWLEFEIIS